MRFRCSRAVLAVVLCLSAGPSCLCHSAELTFEEAVRPLLERSCLECHGDGKIRGQVDFSRIRTDSDADARFELWETVIEMVESGEMPPDEKPRLAEHERQIIVDWYKGRLAAPVQARPGVFRPRRLSGPEYRNTLRSLFGYDLEVTIAEAQQTVAGEKSLVLKLLPKDPPGASGFLNDTHGAALSPVIWEQYAFLTEAVLEKLFAPKQRRHLQVLLGDALPSGWEVGDFTEEQAVSLLRRFVPRALRRPVPESQYATILGSLRGKTGQDLLQAVKFEMKAVLLSPPFLYRGLLMEGKPGRQPVDNFELAERLSYFLWEDRPDEELSSLAQSGKLADPEVLAAQVTRMLESPAARSLAESFGVQWLGIANLDELITNPIAHHALRTQPVLFLDYLFTRNRPVMELIDSRTTFINTGVSGFYGADRGRMKLHRKPKGIERQTTPFERFTLEKATWRGGIITMPGMLTMNRGPIQRGTWLLRRVLGERLGEPPADIPPVRPSPPGEKLTFRERFERHRSDASCARCHEKIDPIGFALDGYDANGRFLLADKKKAAEGIDTSGKLPTGESFSDYEGLKEILLTTQRRPVVRNAVERTLSYALCRKTERSDYPVIEEITEKIVESDGTWKDLFVEIVMSLSFRETIIETPESQ